MTKEQLEADTAIKACDKWREAYRLMSESHTREWGEMSARHERESAAIGGALSTAQDLESEAIGRCP